MEAFLGTFVLERSEKFDEYLQARGINWMLRKMMSLAGVTKIFSPDENAVSFHLINKTAKGTFDWHFKLGEDLEAKGFDDKMHRITFYLEDDGATLCEKHIRLDDPNDKGEVYKYTREGDYLVLHLSAGDVQCKRYLKKKC